jgi:2-polyprenyl-3-methyl-5-hydroxy-6-metoxy-1,4-benzoquinol methylase
MHHLVGPGIITDYPWNELDSKTIVDVGGGQGALSVDLAKE